MYVYRKYEIIPLVGIILFMRMINNIIKTPVPDIGNLLLRCWRGEFKIVKA